MTYTHIMQYMRTTLAVLIAVFAVSPFISNVDFVAGELSLTTSAAYAQYFDDYYDGGYVSDYGCCDDYYSSYYDGGYSYDYGDTGWSYDYYDGGSAYDYNTGWNFDDYYDGGSSYDYYDTGWGSDYYDGGSAYDYNTGWNFDDYYDGGVVGDGCCDDTTDYYDGGIVSDYGDTGWNFDDYYDGGVVGDGCCDEYGWNFDDYYDGGVVGDGCCDDDVIVYEDTWDEWYYPYDYGSTGWSYTYDYYDYDVWYDTYDYGDTGWDYPYEPCTGSHCYPPTPCTGTNCNPPTPTPAPTCVLTVVPRTIDDNERATLTWTTRYATNVRIDEGIGSVPAYGTRTVSPNADTTYTLTATGPGGSVTCNQTLTVEEEEEEVLRCDSFTASPSDVDEGDYVTLEWRTTGADDVDINEGIGDVADDGSERVRVDEDTTFILTARNNSDSVTCRVSVDVDEDVDDLSCELRVTPSSVDEDDYVTVEWETTGADDVDINEGIGDVADDGSERVRVDEDTTFILTARNDDDTITCRDDVEVDEEDEDAPRCEFRASDTDIDAGDRVTLRWDNDRTDRVVIRDNHGHEVADSDDDRNVDEDTDSIVVRPTRDTEYTLTAYNDDGRDICRVDIDVESDVTVTSNRVQGATTTVYLTQVPYTGFDAGPFLTTVFYSLIVLWGVIVAYVLVKRRKGSVAAVATASPMTLATAPLQTIAPMPAMGIMAAPSNLPVAQMPFETALQTVETDSETATFDELEARAHDARVLISSDALHFIVGQCTDAAERTTLLDRVIASAKAAYPSEDGWVVVNKERMLELLK